MLLTHTSPDSQTTTKLKQVLSTNFFTQHKRIQNFPRINVHGSRQVCVYRVEKQVVVNVSPRQ